MRFAHKSLALGLGLSVLVGCSSDVGPAKEFKVVPLDDQAKSVTLSDFKGKTVLLDFWATWCGPCKQAMPEIQAAWEKYHSKGLEIASISKEDRMTILGFHKSTPFTYPVYVDVDGSASVAYDATALPLFVLIKNGRIVWQQKGFDKGDVARAISDALG